MQKNPSQVKICTGGKLGRMVFGIPEWSRRFHARRWPARAFSAFVRRKASRSSGRIFLGGDDRPQDRAENTAAPSVEREADRQRNGVSRSSGSR